MTGGPGEALPTALNVADQPVVLDLPDSALAAPSVVAGGAASAASVDGARLRLSLPAHAWAVLADQ